MRLLLACAAIGSAFVLAACGGGSGDSASETATATTALAAVSPCDRPGPSSLAAAGCAGTGLASLDPAFSASFEPPKAETGGGGGGELAELQCPPAPQIVFYAQDDWLRLAQKLAADPYECADYYIAVPPTEDSEGLFTVPNRGQAERIHALGERFHALASFQVDAWTTWRERHPGTSWKEIGAEYRKRMDAAGYDVAAGDFWAVNELPLEVASDEGVRAAMLDLVEGLAGGGGQRAPGLVFVVSPQQETADLGGYRSQLEQLLRDSSFWEAMSRDVRFWAQEVYANPGSCCVAGAGDASRIARTNEYLQHVRTLVGRDPRAEAARAFLERAYLPLGNAAWSWTEAYGDTAIPVEQMARFVAQQVEAMRAVKDAGGRPAIALGFAWAPLQPAGTDRSAFVKDTGTLLDAIAAAIARTFRENEPGAACGEAGCDCEVAGASFNDAWAGFGR